MAGQRGGPWAAAGGVVLAILLGRAGLRWFERANLYFPSREFTILPRSYGLAYEDVALRADDGVALHGWYIPAGPFSPAPKDKPVDGPLAPLGLTVLLCHGNAGTISNRVPKANILHRLGLSVLLFDYRGYGRSEGGPSERGTYRDAEAAYRWLLETKRVPQDRIVLYGESLGNGVAVETALRRPPRALILESAFTSVVDMGRLLFPFLPVRWMVTDRYDNLSKIPAIRCPVLVLHSRDDDVVPYAMGRRLYEAATAPKAFLEMRGTHDEGYLDSGPAYPEALRSFLERYAR